MRIAMRQGSVLLLCLLLLAGCGFGVGRDGTVGDAADGAPDFTMATLDGGEVTLSELRGRYVLVNFWATWCVPCRKEMPYLQKIADEHGERLTVLGVNMREEPERIAPFVDELGLTFPILLDPPNELLLAHNVRGLPVSFVVDPEGAVVYSKVGELQPDELDPWLAKNVR